MEPFLSRISTTEASTAGKNQVRRTERRKIRLITSSVPETLEKIFKSRGEDSYRRYKAVQELERRIKRQELEDEIKMDELRKRGRIPVDYAQYSTEDEQLSDYEL